MSGNGNGKHTMYAIKWLREFGPDRPSEEILQGFLNDFPGELKDIDLGDWEVAMAECRDVTRDLEIEQKRGEIVDL